jgi:hypothetical protein
MKKPRPKKSKASGGTPLANTKRGGMRVAPRQPLPKPPDPPTPPGGQTC